MVSSADATLPRHVNSIRRSSSFNTGRIEHLYKDVHERESREERAPLDQNDQILDNFSPLPQARKWSFTTVVSIEEENVFLQKIHIVLTWIGLLADLTDTTNLVGIISSIQPTEIYNLAAQSHVKVSFDMAEYTVGRRQ